MDTSLIEAYAAAMKTQPQMTEVEIVADGVHIRLRRTIATVEAPSTEAQEVTPSGPILDKPVHVMSQSVGVFVPAVPPFAVGDIVDGSRPLGAIDTVGITNAVVSPATGTVSAVHVVEGQPVEYGQVLFDLVESQSS